MSVSAVESWRLGEVALREGRLGEAWAAYERVAAEAGSVVPGRLRLSLVASMQGRVRESVAQALVGFEARAGVDAVLMEGLAQRLAEVGELEASVACATDPVVAGARDPGVLAGAGTLLGNQSMPALALPLLERAREVGGPSPSLAGRIGRELSYLGQADAAERELEACIAGGGPGAAVAWRDLARLRRWSGENNHVGRLRDALVQLGGSHPNAPLLHYALFKELDDLGETAAAWDALAAGMRVRRGQVVFDDAAEAALFEALHEVAADPSCRSRYSGDSTSRDTSANGIAAIAAPTGGAAGGAAVAGPQPIFIVGLPRSGTTLLERVLGGHPEVADAGELRDFAAQLRWMTELPGSNQLDAALVHAAGAIDFAELGERYLAHTRWHAGGKRFYTDKLPANYLNVGFIARALPQAKILHMARAPMDACFSNLKELFGDAYPHSYDMDEMANHYLRYRKLMAHWHEAFPGRILDVQYEALAAEPERVAREVLVFCGLDWDSAVLAPEQRTGAVATASTAQVREPIHSRFVGQWRRYERELQPLRERLERAGLVNGLM